MFAYKYNIDKIILFGSRARGTHTEKSDVDIAVSYDEDEIDELLLLIRDSFISAFTVLEKTLREKLDEAGDDWTSENI